jgi:hypothetical protein
VTWFERAVFASVILATSCASKHEATPNAAASPSASVAASPSAAPSAVTVNATTQRFTGKWTGTYRAEAHRIELAPAQGGLPEWKVDDPKRGVGDGALSLVTDNDGSVSGTATGALGTETLRGAFDGDAFTARLIPAAGDANGFAGTLTATRAPGGGDRFTGTLRAGSPDGVRARTGTFTLAMNAP